MGGWRSEGGGGDNETDVGATRGRPVNQHDSSHRLVTRRTNSKYDPGGAVYPTYWDSIFVRGVFKAECVFGGVLSTVGGGGRGGGEG